MRRRFADPPADHPLLTPEQRAAQKSAGAQHHRAGAQQRAIRKSDAARFPASQIERSRFTRDQRQIALLA